MSNFFQPGFDAIRNTLGPLIGIQPQSQQLISPVPEPYDLSNTALLDYYKNNQAMEEQAKREASLPAPKYPEFTYNSEIANAPQIQKPTPQPQQNPLQGFFKNVENAINPQIPQQLANTTNIKPFKYQDAVTNAMKANNLSPNEYNLLRASENMGENPNAVNVNDNGTWDVGLYQINVDPNNTAEVQRLKDPAYNAMRAGQIYSQRLNTLKDPALALGSYNLGATGAVNNPEAALKRAQWVYYKANTPMPKTPFTQNPQGYIQQNRDYFKKVGLMN